MIKTKCPHCGGPLILFPGSNQKACADCYRTYSWELEEGQKSLFSSSRANRGKPKP